MYAPYYGLRNSSGSSGSFAMFAANPFRLRFWREFSFKTLFGHPMMFLNPNDVPESNGPLPLLN
jgi:hypothetical protein